MDGDGKFQLAVDEIAGADASGADNLHGWGVERRGRPTDERNGPRFGERAVVSRAGGEGVLKFLRGDFSKKHFSSRKDPRGIFWAMLYSFKGRNSWLQGANKYRGLYSFRF